MAYNYVVTAQKPTSVTHSLTGAFTSPIDMNLILAKCSRLEIHRMTPDGLSPVLDVQIYGRVAVLELFRPENEKKDLMFLCTEHYQFCVLAYDPETQRVLTRARGNVRDAIGRCADVMQGVVDPRCRVIGLFLYEGYYKVLPVDPKTGTLRESFNVRLHELRVLNIVFLDGFAHPTLGLLYEDNRGGKHVKTYSILVKERELVEGPWYQSNVEPGARLLVPVPSPAGGVIIVGETSIVYHSGKTFKAISIPNALIDVYTSIDADRTLLADTFGNLHVLALDRPTPEKVKTLRIECLGKTSAASTLSYLDTGVVFVGSAMGDSQLIRLLAERSVVDNDQPQSSFIQILDTYTNVGPIVDFCVMDLDRQGQGQIVSCSGAYKDGSLRVIRSGIGLAEQATIEMPGVKGMWALGEHSDAMYDKYLVMSFISETRVMVLNGEELEELDTLVGFAEDTKTLCCHTMLGGFWIQVTETQVRLISTSTFQMVDKWAPEEEEGANRISVATATSTQIVVATLGGKVYVLDIVGNNIREVNQVTFGHEISCLAISSSENHKMCAVGLWVDISVTLISLPGCQKLKIEPLGGQVIPRSVIFGCFHALEYLFVGLGDGSLVSYKLKSTRATDDDRELIYDRKKVTLGSQPITLARFQTKGQEHIFAASDRPTIIYSNTDKLLYSNVNAKEVMLMCPFNGASFPDSLALVSETEMMVGNIDDIQKLHIQSYHLNEWPRRIAHDPRSNTVAVCTLKNPEDEENGGPAEIGDLSFVRLFDDQNFDMLDFYQLDPMEYACSITVCGSTFGNPTDALDTLTKEGSAPFYYVVGTAYAHDEEPEPHQGRILIFSILGHGCDRKLHLCCEKDVTGAVYCVMEFQGQLVAGVNSKTDIYKLVVVDGEKELVHECGHHGNILVLYLQCHGDFIIVGDLVRVCVCMFSSKNIQKCQILKYALSLSLLW